MASQNQSNGLLLAGLTTFAGLAGATLPTHEAYARDVVERRIPIGPEPTYSSVAELLYTPQSRGGTVSRYALFDQQIPTGEHQATLKIAASIVSGTSPLELADLQEAPFSSVQWGIQIIIWDKSLLDPNNLSTGQVGNITINNSSEPIVARGHFGTSGSDQVFELTYDFMIPELSAINQEFVIGYTGHFLNTPMNSGLLYRVPSTPPSASQPTPIITQNPISDYIGIMRASGTGDSVTRFGGLQGSGYAPFNLELNPVPTPGAMLTAAAALGVLGSRRRRDATTSEKTTS